MGSSLSFEGCISLLMRGLPGRHRLFRVLDCRQKNAQVSTSKINWIPAVDDQQLSLTYSKRFQFAARVCAIAVAVLGLAVLIGWALNIEALKVLVPGWVSMKANTAFGFFLAGSALLAADRSETAPGWRSIHLLLVTIVTLLGLLTFGEYVFAADFGIDQLLFTSPPELVSMTQPGRMALASTFGFMFTGLALGLINSRHGPFCLVAALIGNLIGLLAALGYVYNVESLYGVGA